MEAWDSWGAGRLAVVLAAIMYLGIWVQLSLFHWAGGFRKLAMWGPVIITPLIAGGAVAGAAARDGVWGPLAAGLLGLGVLDGLIGLYYHWRGIVSQIGGLSVRNLLAGPPPVLPLAYSLIGLVGLTGLLVDG